MTPPTPQPPLTIFIVDDNPVDVGLIRWVLDAHALPYALHVIDNGDHALQVFDQLANNRFLGSLATTLKISNPLSVNVNVGYTNQTINRNLS